jgi:hypothetical protein
MNLTSPITFNSPTSEVAVADTPRTARLVAMVREASKNMADFSCVKDDGGAWTVKKIEPLSNRILARVAAIDLKDLVLKYQRLEKMTYNVLLGPHLAKVKSQLISFDRQEALINGKIDKKQGPELARQRERLGRVKAQMAKLSRDSAAIEETLRDHRETLQKNLQEILATYQESPDPLKQVIPHFESLNAEEALKSLGDAIRFLKK